MSYLDRLATVLSPRLLSALGLAVISHSGPCDIYAADGTPCVAAHSTVRALYGAYDGPLYEVIRGSDNTTKAIGVRHRGGVADSETQDDFCDSTTCLITVIYDQSGRNNHLTDAPPGSADRGENPGGYDLLAGATGAPVELNGHRAYGVFTPQGSGYRCDNTSGVAVDNEPEGMYAVFDGSHFNGDCCYDYGNAETTANDEGAGTMETLYFGGAGRGLETDDKGPWVMADLEDGVFAGNERGSRYPGVNHRFVTAILKGSSENLWSLRGGDAAHGKLDTFFSGPRPEGYYPMKKKGAILLGVGGDNSFRGIGTFYEGAMTKGYPSDKTEDKVQKNIVAAGYSPTSASTGHSLHVGSKVSFKASNGAYLGQKDTDVKLVSASSDSTHAHARFTVRKGKSDKTCYSFESVETPGSFIRQAGHQLFVDAPNSTRPSVSPLHWFRTSNNSYVDDITFCTEPAFDGSGGVSLRSWEFPTCYWRPFGDEDAVYIASNGGVDVWDEAKGFNEGASWSIVKA